MEHGIHIYRMIHHRTMKQSYNDKADTETRTRTSTNNTNTSSLTTISKPTIHSV